MARLGPKQMGRVGPLCPGTSDLNLLGNSEGVIDFDPKVSDGTLDPAMTQQKLNSAKIPGAPID